MKERFTVPASAGRQAEVIEGADIGAPLRLGNNTRPNGETVTF